MADALGLRRGCAARPALLAVLAALLLIAFLVWRAIFASNGILARSPAPGAADVPGTASVSVRFAQPMNTGQLPALSLAPDIAGAASVMATVQWQDDTTLILRPATPLLPGSAYRVSLPPQLQSAAGESVRGGQSWRFTTRSLRVLFLDWDEQERPQLYSMDAGGGPRSQLTTADLGVLDYAAAPDGRRIAYTVALEGGSRDLWLLTLQAGAVQAQRLLDCGGDQCSGPAWSPDGRRLVYERRAHSPSADHPEAPRLWWLDPASGATTHLFDDEQQLGHTARFSPNGRWLSYIVPLERAMHVFDLQSGDVLRIANEVGEPAAWHPWRDQLLFANIEYVGESYTTLIMRLDLPAGQLSHLTPGLITDDGAPTWSPAGDALAFGRKAPVAPVGRQLWTMDADGGRATALTDDPRFNFGPPSWSPDGAHLLAQRFDITQPRSDPGIWLVDSRNGAQTMLSASGFQPAWLP